jgi:hypothetical protein
MSHYLVKPANKQNQADLKERGSLSQGLVVVDGASSGLFWALGGWNSCPVY